MTIPLITNITSTLNPGSLMAVATEQQGAAATFLTQLANAAASLGAPTINPQFPLGSAAPTLQLTTGPTLEPVVWEAPALPAEFTGELSVEDLFLEPFTIEAPELLLGTPPTEFSEAAPEDVGVNLDIVVPELSLTLPDAPDLLAISVSPFSGINMPTLTAVEPTLTLVEPTIREYLPGAAYSSTLLDALNASLEDRISGGGTGLGQVAETALWERGVEREARGAAQALAQLEEMEVLGYALPPGAYIDQRTRIITEMDYASRGHSREVMVESARLELDNVKHALTTGVQLEGTLINYANQVEQRAFESSRYATEAGIAIYNAGVQAFQARVEVYRALVSAYEAAIRGELGRVEAYRAEVAAESAKADVNRSIVERFRGQVEAALGNVRIYEARIQGIQAQADVERTKVAIFGEQVRAFGAKVNAYTAGVEGYRARMQGEIAKQDAYTSRVRAYTAQVEASSKNIDARIAAYRGDLDGYLGTLEAYKTKFQSEAARAQAITAQNTAAATIYEANVRGVAAYNDAMTKQWQAILDQGQRTSEISISAAKTNAELYVTTRSLALDAAKVGAQVSAQLGAAALSTLNYSESFGQSRSDSAGNNYSDSDSRAISTSVSTSNSTSTSYNYNYSV